MIDELSKFIDMQKLSEETKTERVRVEKQKMERSMTIKKRRKELRPQTLPTVKESESQIKRVSIEAIDFDWIFEGDNAREFILLLTYKARSKIYIQKSVRVFVKLIWELYQPQIVKKIFMPYLFYMMIIMYLSVYHLGGFLEHLDHIEDGSSITNERNFVVFLSIIAMCLIGFFVNIEYSQAKQSWSDYFIDYWNYIDALSLGLNFMFLVMLNTNCFLVSNEYFTKEKIRLNASVGCFILWVKLFYWMRLFKVTAYFITLITQTIFDIRVFMIMLSIMLIAFASFFSILNTDTIEYHDTGADVPDANGYHYVDQYIG